MTETLETLIVGAGCVGAAVAYALRDRGDAVFVVDAEAGPGRGMTSRNSGVIHAGIYYPADSLKTRLCRRGNRMLYAFAERFEVPVARTGKYIVAQDDEGIACLETLKRENAEVPLAWASRIPDGIRARRALFSPTTGIVDPHVFVERLLTVSNAEVLYHQRVTTLRPEGDHVAVTIDGERYLARRVFNCAGLDAAGLTRDVRHHYARGAYFQIAIPAGLEVPALVYPAVPKKSPSLGIHLTRNIHGEAYLGPDIEWIESPSFVLDPERGPSFYEAARQYLPWLEPDHLQPGYTGIRAKLSRERFSDFTFVREGRLGQLVHCLGIESPGLTSSLAIGAHLTEGMDAGV